MVSRHMEVKQYFSVGLWVTFRKTARMRPVSELPEVSGVSPAIQKNQIKTTNYLPIIGLKLAGFRIYL